MIALVTDDLLFGSRLQAALAGAGHETEIVDRPPADAELIVLDLCFAADARLAAVASLERPRPPVLAYYAHVETAVRDRARQADIELVVPRSRIAREGAALAERLLRAPRTSG